MDNQQDSGLNSPIPNTQEPQEETVRTSSQNTSALPAPGQQVAPPSAQPAIPAASPSSGSVGSNPIASTNASAQLNTKFSTESPQVAEDVDLIEKEWVNKAKEIVAKTKNDPSQQNIQLNKFKADYLKTRFSKEIKPMDS